MRADLLDVIAVIVNPIRWESRVRLFNDFVWHVPEDGMRLTIVECAYGCDHGRSTMPPANMVRVRAQLRWNKENLINISIGRLPHDWNLRLGGVCQRQRR